VLAAIFLGPPLGTLGLALGVALGALAYLVVQLPAARANGFRWRARFDLADPGLRRIGTLMLPRMVGQGAVQLSLIFTTRLASYLPDGRIGALSYAFQLMMLPLSTFAMSLAGAAFPTLSEQVARADRAGYESTVRRTLSAIAFVLVPSTVALVVAGLPLVQALFERGRFGPESSALTATALAMYAAGLPAHGAIEILVRAFYALQDTRTPVAIAVVAMVANAVLASTLVGPLGHLGIALALSVSASAEAVLLAATLYRRRPTVFSGALAVSLARTALAAAALAGVALAALAAARHVGLHPLFQVIGSLVPGGLAYLAVAYVLRSPDLLTVIGIIRRRLPPLYSRERPPPAAPAPP
jgi:putative peptidoglycan lipid II flippase